MRAICTRFTRRLGIHGSLAEDVQRSSAMRYHFAKNLLYTSARHSSLLPYHPLTNVRTTEVVPILLQILARARPVQTPSYIHCSTSLNCMYVQDPNHIYGRSMYGSFVDAHDHYYLLSTSVHPFVVAIAIGTRLVLSMMGL